MAFENINWGMPVQAKANEAANFQSMIGQAIASYQAGQERDIKRRQLEMEGVNVEKVAENALLKQNMGMPLTPKEQAAIQTMGQIGRPQVYTDAYGQQVVQPSPWSSLGMPQAQAQPRGAGAPMAAPGDEIYGGIPPVDLNMPIQSGGKTPLGQPLNQNMIMGMETMPPVAPKMPANKMPDLKVEGALSGTPKGALMEAEALLKLKGEKAKIDLEKTSGMPKAEKRLIQSVTDWQSSSRSIDQAIKKISPFSAGVGSLTAIIPQTPARDLSALLKTVKADAAFGALQEMRDNSPTGGALGSIAVPELELLQSKVAALDEGQSPEQLKAQLIDYQNTRKQSLKKVIDAFYQDYGYKPKVILDLIKEDEKPRLTPEQARAELARRKGQ